MYRASPTKDRSPERRYETGRNPSRSPVKRPRGMRSPRRCRYYDSDEPWETPPREVPPPHPLTDLRIEIDEAKFKNPDRPAPSSSTSGSGSSSSPPERPKEKPSKKEKKDKEAKKERRERRKARKERNAKKRAKKLAKAEKKARKAAKVAAAAAASKATKTPATASSAVPAAPAVGPAPTESKPKPASPEVDRSRAPMTKEEWEKRQSRIRREVSPTTGRTRLIKGDGEVLEEIVSRARHQKINKLATAGDGLAFQKSLLGGKR